MPLENLFQKTDESRSRQRTTVGLIFLGLAIYLIAAYAYFIFNYQKENEKRIAAANRKISVDSFCRQIDAQLPSGLHFLERTESAPDDDTTTVVYRYNSAIAPPEIKRQYVKVAEIRFIDWLKYRGWHAADNSDSLFTSANQTIRLVENQNDFANFELQCSETKISFGIY